MSQELVTYEEIQTIGKTFAASGYFQDARDAAQAIVKIMAGRELGIGPVASMSGVYIVKGKPALSANLLAGVLKKSGKYDYRVVTLTDDTCEIAFFQGAQEIGRSVFTLADAKKAGTQNIEKFPRNMLFARAMTNGCRWYAPDVFAGGIYTPEELGERTDGETGEIIEARPTPTTIAPPATPQAETKAPSAPSKPAVTDPAPTAKMWSTWYSLTAEARLEGVQFTDLDNNVSALELAAAGKDLRAKVAEAKLQNLTNGKDVTNA